MSNGPLKELHHYSMENPSTIYDEEAMTALKLAARCAGKVNECVRAIINHQHETTTALAAQDKKIAQAFEVEIPGHVDSWLEAHPEAYTTVQPGTLEAKHFSDDLLKAVDNGYITPQMYGAIGDGVADDTEPFFMALQSGRKMFIPAGDYIVETRLFAYNSILAEKGATIHYRATGGNPCIAFRGEQVELCKEAACTITDKTMVVSTSAFPCEVKPGDHIYINTTTKASSFSRDYDTKQDMLEVESVSGTTITFTTVPEWPEMDRVSLYLLQPIENLEISGLKILNEKAGAWTSGLYLENVRNVEVSNCHIEGFDYGQIDVKFGVNVRIHDNYCAVNYADELQYGIIVSHVYHSTIHGNTVNSERTAIDLSYGSQYVTVSGNTTRGSINTHWAINCIIIGNTINNGFVLLRGKKLSVLDNFITQLSKTTSAIEVSEGGNEGGHLIQGNTVYGVLGIKTVMSGMRVLNNTFKVTKCVQYYDTESSAIRLSSASEAATPSAGIEISGNHIEFIGSGPAACGIDMYYNTDATTKNVRIANNVIRNFTTGIKACVRTQDKGKNLTITGNDIQEVSIGIQFRGMDHVVITGNNIIGKDGASKGIERFSTDINTTGLVIHGNMLVGFVTGLTIYSGQGTIADGVIENNCYVGCTTQRNVSAAKIVPQAPEYPA